MSRAANRVAGTRELLQAQVGNDGIENFGDRRVQFERRAVTPERVAERIIDGIENDRFLVFTSRDIQILHWFQRKFAWPYEALMRQANDRMVAIAERPR